MTSTTSAMHGRRGHHPRPWPLATAALGTVALAATTGALAARLTAAWPEVLAAGRRWPAPSPVAIDTLVAVPLLAVGTVVAAWWGLSLLLITASLMADRAGLHSAALVRCIHAVAPRTLRRLAVAGVGAGLTFSTLPAHAAQEPPDVGWTTAQQSAVTDPHTAADADGATRPAPVDPTGLGPLVPLADAEAEAVRPDLAPGVVVVAPGDTLWDLAAARLSPEATDSQIATSWHAWYALNVSVIGDDPDLLHPGQLLHVPPAG